MLGIGIVSASIIPSYAQGVGEGGDIDIEGSLFPNTKKGCEMRAQFNYAMIKSFQNGDSPSSIANFKMLEPLIEKTFNTVKTNGVSQAHINSISEYKACVQGAQPVKNPEKELLLVSKHASCTKLTDVILGSLEGIQSREKLETIQGRYAAEKIEFIDTGYENFSFKGQELPDTEVQNPVPMFIKSLYDVGQEKSYDTAVEQGAGIIMGCFSGK